MKKALVSVTGRDQTGIIAKVSMQLYHMNINVLEVSQKILDGYFMMIMIVDITSMEGSFPETAQSLRELGEEIGVTISIQRTDIYDAMHRI